MAKDLPPNTVRVEEPSLVVYTEPLFKGWSDAAREAAAEARRQAKEEGVSDDHADAAATLTGKLVEGKFPQNPTAAPVERNRAISIGVEQAYRANAGKISKAKAHKEAAAALTKAGYEIDHQGESMGSPVTLFKGKDGVKGAIQNHYKSAVYDVQWNNPDGTVAKGSGYDTDPFKAIKKAENDR